MPCMRLLVVWEVRDPNPKISRSYELYRRDIQLQRFQTWAYEISATPLEADSWAYGINRHLW